jgi:hypothetical protein
MQVEEEEGEGGGEKEEVSIQGISRNKGEKVNRYLFLDSYVQTNL